MYWLKLLINSEVSSSLKENITCNHFLLDSNGVLIYLFKFIFRCNDEEFYRSYEYSGINSAVFGKLISFKFC